MLIAPPKTLRVVANPYCAVDHKGRPAGAFPAYPFDENGKPMRVPGEPQRFVGAMIDAEKTRIVSKAQPGDGRQSTQDTVYRFAIEPVSVPNIHYYRAAIRDGSLIPADEQTARDCERAFQPVVTALAEARKKASFAWQAQHRSAPPFMQNEQAAV